MNEVRVLKQIISSNNLLFHRLIKFQIQYRI